MDVERLALDALSIGVIVTDTSAHVLYANATAERFLDAVGGALCRVCEKVAATNHAKNATLGMLIARACGQETASSAGDHLLVTARAQGSPDVALRVMPAGDAGEVGSGRAIIFVREIERACNLEIEAMRLFGLTTMEAKVASALASGLSLADAAAGLGVSVATGRAHLSRVFQKTGTRQQSQVAALLRGAQIPVEPARVPG